MWSEDQCLANPKTKREARAMLGQLSGKMHEVITSVGFTQAHNQRSFTKPVKCTLKPLVKAEIDYYIEEYQPYDKAGAYGIQEWIGTIGIEKIEGSYTNIVGLPVAQVLATLEKICRP